MSKYLFVGCDLHDNSMLLKIGVDDQASRHKSYVNAGEDRVQMISDLLTSAKEVGRVQVVFAYEASGCGFGLYDELSEAGITCHVFAPTRLHHTPKSQKNKTDAKDAENLLTVLRSHYLAGGALPTVWAPDQALRDERQVIRARMDVGEKISKVKTQIQAVLKSFEVKPEKSLGERWSKKYLEHLKLLSQKDAPLNAWTRERLGTLLRQLEFLQQEEKHLDEAILKLSRTPKYQKAFNALRQVPGVGPLTAMAFLTEIGDPRRFHNRREIGAFFGLAPSSYESGEDNDHKGHITHQGSPMMRKLLCQAYWCSLRVNIHEQKRFDHMIARNPKKRKIATVAGMRRLAILLWHLMMDAMPPEPEADPRARKRSRVNP